MNTFVFSMMTPSNGNIFRVTGPLCGELGPSTLAVPDQLYNGGGKNVGHSPAESGTDS